MKIFQIQEKNVDEHNSFLFFRKEEAVRNVHIQHKSLINWFINYMHSRSKLKTLAVAYRYFEREILLHVLDHQDQKRQLDCKSFIRVGGARNVRHATSIHHN